MFDGPACSVGESVTVSMFSNARRSCVVADAGNSGVQKWNVCPPVADRSRLCTVMRFFFALSSILNLIAISLLTNRINRTGHFPPCIFFFFFPFVSYSHTE